MKYHTQRSKTIRSFNKSIGYMEGFADVQVSVDKLLRAIARMCASCDSPKRQ